MHKLTHTMVELLFPRLCFSCGRTGKYLCEQCLVMYLVQRYQQQCHVCKLPIMGGFVHAECAEFTYLDGVFIAFAYSDLYAQLLHAAKYKFQRAVLSELVEIIVTKSYEFTLPPDCIALGIPLSKYKFRQRGFNQADVLAQAVAAAHQLSYSKVLERRRITSTQVGQGREWRKQNLRGAFSLTQSVAGQSFLLVDDVMTTGSTLEECARVLRQGGAKKVYALVGARG